MTGSGTSSAIPAGTVTLLLGDVEGLVRIWESDPASARATIKRLDEIVASMARQHNGTVPREHGDADSFILVFPRAFDAVACALDIQLALLEDDSLGEIGQRVRVALHTGEVEVGDEEKYAGPAVNRCARLRDIAHGGQTLVSQSTFELTADALPGGVSFGDLGRHRLRDLARPEHVYQLGHPSLPKKFPQLRSLDALPNNLPLQLTSFIGRELEIGEVNKLLEENRIVTLTGAGGCGKTRLSLQLAAQVVDEYPDGVWWLDLAPIADGGLVAGALGSLLSLRGLESHALTEALVRHLRDRRALILLDNCEHVVAACAELAIALLLACPEVRILASSREPLGVQGEISYRIPSLGFPEDPENVDDLSSFESVLLFVDRARRARPGFKITEENERAIARICRRLEGIPLAIELAAARTRALSPIQVADALSARFDLLSGGVRTALPRQRTLEASVDWSYGLLTEDEQTLLARVSVFAGGFSLEAAEDVCSSEPIDSYAVLNLVSSLVDKSLIQVDETNSEARYRLLETVRAFARDKLTNSTEAAEVRNRHLDYYVSLAERAGQEMRDRGFANVTEAVGGPQPLGELLTKTDLRTIGERVELDVRGRGFADWFDRLSAETDNLRAAMDWALASGQADKHLQISGSLLIFWNHRGLFSEMHVYMEAALAAATDAPVRAKALATASGLSVMAGHFRVAADRASECIDLARELGDETSLGYGLSYLGWSQFWLGRAGLDKVKEAQRTAQQIGEWRLLGISFFFRTLMEAYLNNAQTASPFLEAAIAAIRMSREPFSLAVATHWASGVYLLQGDLLQASHLLEDSIKLSSAIDHRAFESNAMADLGWVAVHLGDYERAKTLIAEGVRLARGVGRQAEAAAAKSRALMTWALGEPGAEEQVAGSLSAWEEFGNEWVVVQLTLLQGALALRKGDQVVARTRIDSGIRRAREAGFQWLLGQGLLQLAYLEREIGDLKRAESTAQESLRLMDFYGDRAAVCDLLEAVGGVSAELQQFEEGVKFFGAASRLREEIGYVRFPVYQSAYENDLARLRSGIDAEEFERAWAEGMKLEIAEVIPQLR